MSEDGCASYQKSGGASSVHGSGRLPRTQSGPTWEAVDNGLGYGQGWLYDEVHLRRPDEAISSHGDAVESAVFYMESAGNPPDEISVDWRDAKHLVIANDDSPPRRTGKSITPFHGISIEYRVRARR